MTTRSIVIGQGFLAIGLFAAWRALAGIAGPLYIADPVDVFQRLSLETRSGDLARMVYATARLSAIGFLAGASAGIAGPLILNRMIRLRDAVEPFIIASAGIPKYAIVPLLVLWLGIDDAPKLVVIGLLAFYPLFISVSAGIRRVENSLIDTVRLMGGNHLAVVREVIWPSIVPFVLASLRIALPRAVSAAIIADFLVGGDGIGQMIESARQSFDTVGVFAGLALATSLVLAVTVAIMSIEHRAAAWRSEAQRIG